MKLRPSALAVALVGALFLSGPATAADTTSNAVTASPTGANVWTCKPSAAKPYPVVLVHGTFGTMTYWSAMSSALKSAGYCVYALNYGYYATNSIQSSAGQLRNFVAKVLTSTGASKVNIVGHSQGGMMPRYYLKNLGGTAKVNDLVGIAPSNHGTLWTGLTRLVPSGWTCTACTQQLWGAAFLSALNTTDETPGAVSYTTISTTYDQVLVPYTSGYLAGATNVRLQSLCPTDRVDHLGIVSDKVAIRVTLNALGRSGPADPAYRPACT